MWASLTDQLPKTPMGITAENLAVQYKLTREEVDAFALRYDDWLYLETQVVPYI